jgi:hypothetical protein
LCTAFSSAHHLQRRSTSSDERPLLVKDGIGREMASQFGLRFRLPRKSQGSFICRKSATWDRQLYFPSEGRHAVDFFARKIRRLRPGSNPRSWVPEVEWPILWPPRILTFPPGTSCISDIMCMDYGFDMRWEEAWWPVWRWCPTISLWGLRQIWKTTEQRTLGSVYNNPRCNYTILAFISRTLHISGIYHARHQSGFGGLGVSMLASGTQDRGFAPESVPFPNLGAWKRTQLSS